MMKSKERENKKARVVWSMPLHQKFVDAVSQLGIENAVPRKILELMNDKNLTRQHVASHLQTVQDLPFDGFQNGGGLTPILEGFCNESFDTLIDGQVIDYTSSEWWNDLNKDHTSYCPNIASSSCNQCSQISYELAKSKEEIAATKEENRKLREIIQAMQTQKEKLMEIVFADHPTI